MFSQPVESIMEPGKFVTASPETTVQEAAELMSRRHVGAVLVVEQGHLLGIFTERDAVFRVIATGLEPCMTTIAQVMTCDPITISSGKSFGTAMLLMQKNGFRHLPITDDGRPVGIVSARTAMDPDLEEFVVEERRREHFQKML
jgi:CBS domain-containing protein